MPPRGQWRAFTLIELLVVIAVIGVLAGLLLTVGPAVKTRGKIAMVRAQLKQIETAIESYNAKNGFYPPANANLTVNQTRGWCASNSLFYELTGTIYDPTIPPKGGYYDLYQTNTLTVDVGGSVNGMSGITGFANSEAGKRGKNYLSGDPKTEILNGFRFLSVPVLWPANVAGRPFAALPEKNIWFYDSKSQRRHNANSYDLWAELILPTTTGYKTNIIANWKE